MPPYSSHVTPPTFATVIPAMDHLDEHQTLIFWHQSLLRCVDNYIYIQYITDKLLKISEKPFEDGFIFNKHIQ